MAETSSIMIELGAIAPDFSLLNVSNNKMCTLQELKSTMATVIIFMCNHCPYVKHIQSKLIDVAVDYQKQGIHFIAISSNDAEKYPQDGPEYMRKEAELHHYPFPYLYDETQAVAKAYQAACTPDFYVFDDTLSCVYRGRFDDATPGNQHPVTGQDLCTALDAILAGTPVPADQKASLGCNIKWKK